MPKISVIMPVYNASSFLEKSINSVLNQTFKDFEFIIVDDGSCDNSFEIIKKYEQLDKRIVVIHQENAGVSAARNAGIQKAKGDLIAFIDADDFLENDAYEEMIKSLDETNTNCVMCSSYRLWPNGTKTLDKAPFNEGKHNHKKIINNLVKPLLEDRVSENLILGTVWRFLFDRKKILERKIKFYGNYLEDEIFLIEYLSSETSISCVQKPLYNYVQNRESVTRKHMKNYINTFSKSLEIKKKLVSKYNLSVDEEWIYNTSWEGILIAIGNEFANGNNISFFKKKKNLSKIYSYPIFKEAVEKYKPKNLNKNKKIVATLFRKKLYLCLSIMYYVKNVKNIIPNKFLNSATYNAFLKIKKLIKESFFVNLIKKQFTIKDSYKESVFVTGFLSVINFIPNLLYKINKKNPKLFENSIFIKKADRLSILSITLLILGMFIIPQRKWKNIYSLIVALISLVLFWCSGATDVKKRLSFKNISVYPLIFSLVSLASTIWSVEITLSIRYAFFLITCMILVIVLVSALKDEKQLFGLVACIALGIFISSLYAMYQNRIGIAPNALLTDIKVNEKMPGRVFSFFENPNSFANLLVWFLPLMLTMFIYCKKKYQKVGFLITFVTGVIALLLTFSRGGWIALAFSIIVLILILCPKYLPLLICFGVIALPFLPPSILNRFLTIFTGDSSTSLRTYIYSSAVLAIIQKPIYGAGLGMHALRAVIHRNNFYLMTTILFVHTHNIYFQIWGESGIFALIFFILSMLWIIIKSIRLIKSQNTSAHLKGLMAGGVAGLCGSLVFGLTDYAWSYPRIMVLFWILFGIMCVSTKLVENSEIRKD